MKILVFTSSRAAANSFRPETEIFCGLARKGHSVTVMTRTSQEQIDIYHAAGVRVIDGEASKKICLSSISSIRKELKEHDYDIVYATSSKTIPNAAFACIGFKAKLIVYRGTTGGLYRHDPGSYLTVLHPRVDGVICVSNAVREYVSQQAWRKKKNIVTIYKGHNIAWYENIKKADLTEFGIKDTDFSVICVVNARPIKGIVYMLKASNLLAENPGIQLLLVGNGMDEEPYTSLIQNSKMKERIHLAGYRYDVPELIKACDALVLPSIREGLPRVVMEAMGIGTPAVVTATEAGKEIVDNGESGYLVPIKSHEAIAEKVHSLANNPELGEKMAIRGQEKIRNELSAEATVDNYIQYFQSIIVDE